MSNIIIVTEQADRQAAAQGVISLEIAMKRRIQRRRRVAKRLAKRFPMFAVEMMQAEFPGYTQEMFEADISRPTRKGKSFRKPKSPMSRMGRWPLFQRAMSNYRNTGDQKYLEEAQTLRNRMHLPFEVWFVLPQSKRLIVTFPPETDVNIVQSLTKIKGSDYSTREELETILNQRLAFTHFGVIEVVKP